MSMWENKAAFARFLDQAVNNGNLKVMDEIFHREFLGYFPDSAEPARGAEACARWVKVLRDAFPDVNALIEGGWLVGEVGTHEVGKGTVVERVAAFVVMRGTHANPFGGIAGTGARASWGEVHLLTFENGQIIQDVIVRDTFSVLKQIGAASLDKVSLSAAIPPVLI